MDMFRRRNLNEEKTVTVTQGAAGGDVGIVLGSASPRRRKILEAMGFSFSVVAPSTEEIHEAADPVHTVVTNARVKYQACRTSCPQVVLITADTLVWFEGRLIGKPVDLDEAADFLRAFSGRTQLVYTAVALGLPEQAMPDIRVTASSVTFKTLSGADIRSYLEKTHPLDRAGAYDIDENGELLIAGYTGSYTNIMGLPEEVVGDWMQAKGFYHPQLHVHPV